MDLSEEMTVLVGEEEKRFTVPKSFLTKTSDFFYACCNGEWKESKTKTVKLPEQQPDAFATYLQWLYTGELVLEQSFDDLSRESPRDERRQVAHDCNAELISLAFLGDQLAEPGLINAVIDTMIVVFNKCGFLLRKRVVKSLYQDLPENSAVRRLVRDFYATNIQIEYMESHKADYAEELVFDVAIALMKERQSGQKLKTPSYAVRCDYHEHNEKLPKCR